MLKLFKRTLFFISATLVLSSCGSAKESKSASNLDVLFASQPERNHFVGVLVVDPILKDTLYSINAKKYFTPASTTKIITLYTALSLLPERIPVLKYIKQNDTLYFEGAGDPSQLHPYLKDSTAIQFLKEHPNLVWHPNNYNGDLLGPGWAWEDYQYYYQVERGALPLYGNVASIYYTNALHVSPILFEKDVIDLEYTLDREIESNSFYYASSRSDTVEIPFRTDSTLTKKLLQSLLQKPVSTINTMPKGEKSILYGIPSDSVYKRMMHESDNFLADQLLILASGMLSDSLDGNKAREYILSNELNDLSQMPRWVDGSGLSRYNLFTPESMVQVLDKLRRKIPQNRLFHFFVPNEVLESSTDPSSSNSPAYIYAKSGSLGNNYSLNGYLLTKSGKLLIFSFMNNHFTIPTSEIRIQVEEILKKLHDLH